MRASDYFDIHADYQIEVYKNGQLIDVLSHRNLVTVGCKTLVAEFIKGDENIGILYHALGEGDPTWDSLTQPPDPSYVQQTLLAEVGRRPVTSSVYLNDSGNPQSEPSPNVMFRFEHRYSDYNQEFYIREHGLFGGGDATSLPNTGVLTNVRNINRIHMEPGITIVVLYTLHF